MDKPLAIFKPADVRNYAPTKAGRKITHIIIHTMQGTLKGTTAWFQDPKSRASAHYGIGFGGDLIQFVEDDDVAYHAGNLQFNRCSIGIELEGFMERGKFTAAMMDKLVALTKYFMELYKIPAYNVIGHNQVPDPFDPKKLGGAHHHQDPGKTFPWKEFRARLEDPTDTPSDLV